MSHAPKPPTSPSITNFNATGKQQLDQRAVWMFFLKWFFTFAAAGIVSGIYLAITSLENILTIYDATGIVITRILLFTVVILIIIAIAAFIWAKLTYKYYFYELTEDEFKKESGVILKKYVSIPYDQIQHVREFRGILDRILGLADINVFTAGTSSSAGGGRYGSSGEGYLPGLSREVANNLREELVRRSRHARKK